MQSGICARLSVPKVPRRAAFLKTEFLFQGHTLLLPDELCWRGRKEERGKNVNPEASGWRKWLCDSGQHVWTCGGQPQAEPNSASPFMPCFSASSEPCHREQYGLELLLPWPAPAKFPLTEQPGKQMLWAVRLSRSRSLPLDTWAPGSGCG